MAWGMLNNWEFPKVPGLHDFKGPYMHTADYDTTFDPTDKVVALVGGGSTGVQVLPSVQTKARKVKHYMRSQYVTLSYSCLSVFAEISIQELDCACWFRRG